jgi:hypothetical protein
LPESLSRRVVDVLRLDILAPEYKVLRATIKAMREQVIGSR